MSEQSKKAKGQRKAVQNLINKIKRGESSKLLGENREKLTLIGQRRFLLKQLKAVADNDDSTVAVNPRLKYASVGQYKAYKKWYEEDDGFGKTRAKRDQIALDEGATEEINVDNGLKGGQIGNLFSLLASGRIDLEMAKAQAEAIVTRYEEGKTAQLKAGATAKEKKIYEDEQKTQDAMWGNSLKEITQVLRGIDENIEIGLDGNPVLVPPDKPWLSSMLSGRANYEPTAQGDIAYLTDKFGGRQSGIDYKNNETSLAYGLNKTLARYGAGTTPEQSGYDTPEELDAIRNALLYGGYVSASKYLSLGSSVLNAKENSGFARLTKDLNKTGASIEDYLTLSFEESSSLGSSNSPGGGGGGGGGNVEQMDPEEIRQGVETISGQTLGKGIGSAERDQITDELGSEATAASVADQQYDVESRTRRKLRERRPGDAAVTDIMSTFDAFASMMSAGGSFGQSSSQPESIRGPMTGAGGMR